jgi:hypothetical protein
VFRPASWVRRWRASRGRKMAGGFAGGEGVGWLCTCFGCFVGINSLSDVVKSYFGFWKNGDM